MVLRYHNYKLNSEILLFITDGVPMSRGRLHSSLLDENGENISKSHTLRHRRNPRSTALHLSQCSAIERGFPTMTLRRYVAIKEREVDREQRLTRLTNIKAVTGVW